ncbi:MAG: class I SAM-dependent methyltransferase, partial [Alphaproteobacteria bacterium]
MLLAQLLKRVIKTGQLRVIDSRGRVRNYGDPGAKPVTIRLHDSSVRRNILLNPTLALGEAYMDGCLTIEEGDLRALVDLYTRNDLDSLSHPLGRVAEGLSVALRRAQQYNPIRRAQANVAHHYNLSGALYDLFLDADRQYSCAYFLDPNDSLETAQANKKRHIAAKLRLAPGQHVLDIGCGWGGLGLYLAEVADAKVTGITLSSEQLEIANRRSREAGLQERARFFLRDYRKETGRYDRIVSVGMFEHVGIGHFGEYFKKVKELLTEDGVFLLHSIGRMGPPGNTNAWLRKYIFPGGYSPSLPETLAA